MADFCSLKAPFGVDLLLHIFSRQIQNLSKAFLSSQNFGTFMYLALYKHNGKVEDWVFTLLRQQPSQGAKVGIGKIQNHILATFVVCLVSPFYPTVSG